MWRGLCKSDHDSHCDANDNVEEDEGIGSDENKIVKMVKLPQCNDKNISGQGEEWGWGQ